MRTPLNRLPATQLARLLANGEASAEAVTHSFLDAVRDEEARVQAWAYLDPQGALATARELDRGRTRGPLHGLPVAVKDNIDTEGLPSEYGSAIFKGHVPRADAACVAAFRAAGAYTLGKTVTAELANFTPGATRNPHHPDHTPGGSSSGSAAAVAAHMAPWAIGTQTAGSVIRPAAYCGVVGFVPTRGRVPRAGVKAVSDTLDGVGVFARNVADAALLGAALCLELRLARAVEDPVAPILALTATPWAEQLSPVLHSALERTGRLAAQHGAGVRRPVWQEAAPPSFERLAEAQRVVQTYETARALGPEFDYRRAELSGRLATLIEEGRGIAAADYLAALQLGRECALAIDKLMGDADAILAPAAPGEAPAGLASTGDPIFNRAWHLLGAPQICVPLPSAYARGPAGLPLAVQLVGRPGEDARLLASAAWLEATLAEF